MYRSRTLKIVGDKSEGWAFQILEDNEVVYESKRGNNRELIFERGLQWLEDAHEVKPIKNDFRMYGSF